MTYHYNNISFKELLNIIYRIKVNKTISENDIIQPFSKYHNLWNNIPLKKSIIHLWSVLTEQCSNTFFPHPSDAIKLLVLIYFSNEKRHRCFLYLDDDYNILYLSIIYIHDKEEINFATMLDNYFNRHSLIHSMINMGLSINIDSSYWRYIHATLMIVNDNKMYNTLLNDISESLLTQEQLFEQMPLYRGIIITKYVSIHPLDEKYVKNVLYFKEDINMRDENDNQLYFKII